MPFEELPVGCRVAIAKMGCLEVVCGSPRVLSEGCLVASRGIVVVADLAAIADTVPLVAAMTATNGGERLRREH